MTFREKLADWISGGALTDALIQQSYHESSFKIAQKTIRDIYNYTAPQKSGTAQKVARMCVGR